MNNAFCYSREKEKDLIARLPSRLSGACLTVISRLVHDAAYQDQVEDGIEVKRGQILISVDAIHLKTGLSVKTIRNTLDVLEKLNETGKQRANQGANRKILYTIVNYETWDGLSRERGKWIPNKGANGNEKGQMDFIGEIAERGKSPKEVKEVQRSTTIPETAVAVSGTPIKISKEEKQREKLLSSPHWPFIERLSTWFYALPQATELSPVGLLNAQVEILDILTLDMHDTPDCETRLEELVRWATEDESFWKAQVRSLGNLRQRKNPQAPRKWENIESAKQRGKVSAPSPKRDFLDDLHNGKVKLHVAP